MIMLIKFLMVESFMTFYSIQYYKNEFCNKLFLSVCFILEMELYFPDLVKNDRQISALVCLESVANKKACT